MRRIVQAVKAALFDRVCAVGSDRALTHEQRRVVGIDPRCNQLFRVIAFAGSGIVRARVARDGIRAH